MTDAGSLAAILTVVRHARAEHDAGRVVPIASTAVGSISRADRVARSRCRRRDRWNQRVPPKRHPRLTSVE